MQALQQKDYTKAGKNLQEMEEKLSILAKHKTYEEYDIKVLDALANACKNHTIRLENELEESWCHHIRWNLPTQKKEGERPGTASLSVLSSEEAMETLNNTVQALHQLDLLEPKLKILGKRFLQHIAGPVIKGNKSVVTQAVMHNSLPCKEMSLKGRKSKQDPCERLAEVVEALYTAFTFINSRIGNIAVQDKDGSEQLLMELLGKETSEKLLKAIVEESLAPAVPTAKSELQGFGAVVNITEKLQKGLKLLKYIPDTEDTLMKYVNSVNVLFANKKCLKILSEARQLMTSDLHNTVSISNDATHGEFPELLAGFVKASTKEEKTEANKAMATETKLSARTFSFPTCKIR